MLACSAIINGFARRALLHFHMHTTHNSWWLVLGWVTTQERPYAPQIQRHTFTYEALTLASTNIFIYIYIYIYI